MNASISSRVPAGVSTGGQFAASVRGESAADLCVPAHHDHGGATRAERAGTASPARDGIFTDPVDLLRATENHDGSDVAVRRYRAAEVAATRFLGPRPGGEEIRPATLSEARAALRASRAPGRVVELVGIDTIGRQALEVHGHDDGPLTVLNRTGFSHLQVRSGAVVVHADAASGNPVTVHDGATAVIFAGPGRKVSVSVEGSGVAVLVSADRAHGYQRRGEGDGSLDVLREPTDRLTVRTPATGAAVRP